jgi:hypothetical protein
MKDARALTKSSSSFAWQRLLSHAFLIRGAVPSPPNASRPAAIDKACDSTAVNCYRGLLNPRSSPKPFNTVFSSIYWLY